MAAGNHAENGTCALLVMAARPSAAIVKLPNSDNQNSQDPEIRVNEIVTNSTTSPTRFVRAVTIPAPYALGL